MHIPQYPASRALDLADKPLLDGIFAELQPRVSELTFASLYLFRTAHAYRLTMAGGALVVLGRGYGGERYFLPPLSGDIAAAVRSLLGEGMTLYGADEPFAGRYLEGAGAELAEDRDNFDYLYRRSEMAELAGSRYHKKRNRVKYFTNRHCYRVEPYAPAYRAGALALLDEWFRVRRSSGGDSLVGDVEATREALELAGQLGLQGLVVLVEGTVAAFVLGERLNRTTSVCHFEKADPFLDGLSQLVEQEFNRLLFTDCTWTNREQDLGQPGLRAAKMSYHPEELVKKYRAKGSGQNGS
jgi:hypothetical protein